MNILDLGCGRGSGTLMIRNSYDKKVRVFGVDIDKKNIDLANKLYGRDCKFILAKGEDLPFKNNFFDIVCSGEVLEHVINLNKTLSEVNRVLKRGGSFIITFPNEESERRLSQLNPNYLAQIGHRRIINYKELEKKLREKFIIESMKKYNSVEHLYWVFLFKKKYKITSENGDIDRPAPRILTLFEELFNPDKVGPGKNFTYKIIGFFNKIFSKFSFLIDLFFIKKRIKLVLVKK
jgi:ubiquinone/menaquinone biosynthesis C-methylase UbiE